MTYSLSSRDDLNCFCFTAALFGCPPIPLD